LDHHDDAGAGRVVDLEVAIKRNGLSEETGIGTRTR